MACCGNVGYSPVTSPEALHRNARLLERVRRILFTLHSDDPAFAYRSSYILRHHCCQDLVLRIAASEFVVRLLLWFLGMACADASTSVSGDSCLLSIKKGILLSLPSCLCDHVEQYNVFELLCNSRYDMNPDIFA